MQRLAAKQDFAVTAPIKIGDREILKARPYTLLTTTLTTTPTRFAGAVPPFDPLKTGPSRPAKGEPQPDAAPPQDDTHGRPLSQRPILDPPPRLPRP